MVAVALTPQSRLAPSVYWRRRAFALLILAGLVIALVTLAARLGRDPLIASEPTSRHVTLVANRTVTVQPGDTLWSIARAAQPEGDVRELVLELTIARKGAPLQVGEHIDVPIRREVLVGQN
jgi:hypothetical protein